MIISNQREMYIHLLKELCVTEERIVIALDEIYREAISETLQGRLKSHMEESQAQASRIKQLLDGMDVKLPDKKVNYAIEGILRSGDELQLAVDAEHIDDAIIISTQNVETYEITSYVKVINYARSLGENEAAELLTKSLEEEQRMSAYLSDSNQSATKNGG